MLSSWLNCGEIVPQIVFLAFFCLLNFKSVFPVQHFICRILGMVGPLDVKQKGNESTGCYADWGNFEFSRSNCISGMGGPIVMEWKGRESIGCPDVKHYGNKSTGCCADWGTFGLEFSRSNCISGMGGSIVIEQKGHESLGYPDVKHNTMGPEAEDIVTDGVT